MDEELNESQGNLTVGNKHKKILITGSIAAVLIVAVSSIMGFRYFNQFTLKAKSFDLELGKTVEKDANIYVEARDNVLKKTTLDVSKIDTSKVGVYEATATYNDTKLVFKIKVKDTTAPVIILNESLTVIIGKEMAGTTIVKNIEDKAQLKSVTFSTNEIPVASETPENLISTVGIKFDTVGEQKVTISATDENENTSTKDFVVMVIEDYETHATGIQDLTIEQGATVDWMEGITKDEKITEIKVSADAVDINTPGEYKLVYTLVGDDGKTTLDKEIKVTVVAPEQAQEMANTGTAVKVTGGTKEKVVNTPQAKSTQNGGTSSKKGNKQSSGGNSNTGTSSSNSNNNSSGSSGGDFTPGKSWDGTETDNGYIDGPDGNTASSGTWNPWG